MNPSFAFAIVDTNESNYIKNDKRFGNRLYNNIETSNISTDIRLTICSSRHYPNERPNIMNNESDQYNANNTPE